MRALRLQIADPGLFALKRAARAAIVMPAAAALADKVVGPAISLLWASQHLDYLRQLGARLIQPAAEFSSKGANPL